MVIPRGWRRVPAAFREIRGIGGTRHWRCLAPLCGVLSTSGHKFCNGCGRPFLACAARRRRRKLAADEALAHRLAGARTALDAAIVMLMGAAKRVARWRARVSRLESASRTPAEVRRQRAALGQATRRERRHPTAARGIRLREREP